MKRFRNNKKGFTLVEIMSVVAIVSMLTAMSLPNFLRVKMNSNEAAAQANLLSLGKLMEDMRYATGKYPVKHAEITGFVRTYYGKQSVISSEDMGDYYLFQGYRYYLLEQDLAAVSYIWIAEPDQYFITGSRLFSLNAGGTIKMANALPPSSSNNPLADPLKDKTAADNPNDAVNKGDPLPEGTKGAVYEGEGSADTSELFSDDTICTSYPPLCEP